MKKRLLVYLAVGAMVLSAPSALGMTCVDCCDYWIQKAYELLDAGYIQYVETVLMPFIREQCG